MAIICFMVMGSDAYGRDGFAIADNPQVTIPKFIERSIGSTGQWQSSDTLPFNRGTDPMKPSSAQSFTSTLYPSPVPRMVEYGCKIMFDGRDPATGDRKKELAPESLFSYTAPHIKPYLPGEDLLEAQCNFIRFSGGYTFLVITFNWHARNPETSYGRLKANGAIRFTLTGHKTVTLFNNEECTWTYNPQDENFTLQAFYMLHPRQIKLLKKHPLQKATVYWEKGYEEYPIYPITILQNQLQCLD